MNIDPVKNLNELRDTISRMIAEIYEAHAPGIAKSTMAGQPAVPEELRDVSEITDNRYLRLWNRLHEFPFCLEFTKAAAFATSSGLVVLLHDDKGGHHVLMDGALHSVHDKLAELEGGVS